MRAGIYTNRYKDEKLLVTKQLTDALKKSGIEFCLHSDLSDIGVDAPLFDLSEPCGIDFVITVGGDGTILRIAEYCARHNSAILGLNLGFTGFLTEFEAGEILYMIEILKSGAYTLESRGFLCAKACGHSFYALNDVVLLRAEASRMPELRVGVGGEMADRYHCDGFIISTPTGSTAYSLSAGGPIISPNTRAIALTPITPHSLHARPLVVSDSETVTVHVTGQGVRTQLSIDGVPVGLVSSGETVTANMSELTVPFIRRNDKKRASFFGKLLKKLDKWS